MRLYIIYNAHSFKPAHLIKMAGIRAFFEGLAKVIIEKLHCGRRVSEVVQLGNGVLSQSEVKHDDEAARCEATS